MGQVDSLLKRGVELRKQGILDSAFIVLQNAAFDLSATEFQVAHAQCQIGVVCDLTKRWDEAQSYYWKSLANFKSIDSEVGLAKVYKCMGASYSKQGMLDSAFIHYTSAYRIDSSLNRVNELARTHQNLGILLKKQGEIDRAYEEYQRALGLIETDFEPMLTGSILNNLGSLFSSQDDRDSALHYYHLSLDLFEKRSANEKILRCYRNLEKIHAAFSAWDSAYHYASLYHGLHQQVFSEKKEIAISKLQSEIEASELSHKLDLAEINAAHKQLMLWLIILGVAMAGGLVAFILWRKRVLERAITNAMLKGRELESKRISDILLMEVEGSLRVSQEQFPEYLSDNNPFNDAIRAAQFVANLEYNQHLQLGLKPAVEFLLEQLRQEKFLIINEDIDDVILEEDVKLHAYRSVEALVINAVKFQEAGTITVMIKQYEKKLNIVVKSNGGNTHETTLYQSAVGRVYQAKGKITSSVYDHTTETKIEMPV